MEIFEIEKETARLGGAIQDLKKSSSAASRVGIPRRNSQIRNAFEECERVIAEYEEFVR